MRKTIAYLPTIRSPAELGPILARIGWYLYPYRFDIETILLPMAFDPPSAISVPEGYDALVNQRLAEMLPRCEPIFAKTGSSDEVERKLASRADLVLVWHWPEDAAAKRRLSQVLDTLPKGGRWYDVDAASSRAEGSYYLWLGPQCFSDGGAAIEKSRAALGRFGETVKRRKAYVFGTGPSLTTVPDMDFSDGDAYVANSIVKNRELLRRIRPKALVAADPIFHTGCSAYAAEFRRQLIEVLDEFGMYFFVPVRDYYIYESVLPARHLDRLICIPYDDKAPYNIRLTDDFYVNGTGNVLTLFLLPLAATFHEEIAVLGCDGRPRAENKYFWSHDPASQFGDLMQSAKVAHPAFFAIDYDDYYDEHLQTLAAAVGVIEQAGKRLSSLTRSYIPTLADRFAGPSVAVPAVPGEAPLQQVGATPSMSMEVVGLAPDASSEAGHYFGYEDHLLSAFTRAGITYLTLCNKSIPPALLKERPTFHPALSVNTWDIGNMWEEPPASRVQAFVQEVAAGLDALAASRGETARTVYLYYGSLYHVEALARLLQSRPGLTATVNLFWTCNDPIWTDEFGVRWRGLASMLRDNARLNVTVSTVELQRELTTRLGLRLPLAPHPSPTFSDEAYLSLRAARPLPRNESLCRVVFPGMLRRDKGFHLAVEAARCLGAEEGLECSLRSLSADDTPRELVELVQSLGGRTRLVQGELERAGFVDFLRHGDVAVIPYTVKAFARRTSGLLVDALYCGLPVVAIRGSWLGNRVEESGAGIVVGDEDPAALAEAVQAIRSNYSAFQLRALRAGAHWFQSNSWAALAASILAVGKNDD
jgi:glycosyltransferase involved in cell wall biosynthesis